MSHTPLHLPSDHKAVSIGKTGLLLVNLGTPDGTDAGSVRRYLAEFLSDKRVVDYPRALWYPILYGIILNVRPAKTGRNYAKIWRTESDESPLRYFTRQQAELLAARNTNDRLIIDWAMRYGNPSIQERLESLRAQGCDRIVIFPLYPQYSATTTGTVNDRVFEILQDISWQPAIRTVPPFHDHPGYIDALAKSITESFEPEGKPDKIILSFHGLPERYLHKKGDPYHCHCQKTARLLREKMGWDENFAPLGFQSIFGREKWLGPSTESLIEKAAENGIRHVSVIAPGFVSDCIETLEEVGIGLREMFEEKGGEKLSLVPCLNDSTDMIDLLQDIASRETAGWVS
ncbi:ferrochelatase [Parvularcula sp. IMCC14364]|uniref:ferrochelatase n=1 Tax=Parvularcula sp. IMCC14364 TaxID=3067902 RepID=UPI002740B2D5|nr:ferrochelatase [Parvularcula sp. IMCC14364]